MMNNTNGWMSGWSGGGMWLWIVIGVAVVVLLAFVISKPVQEINPADGSNAPVNHKPLKRCVTNQICASNPKNNLNNRQQHIL